MAVYIYTAYDPPPKVVLDDWGESRTRQSEAEACDINNIVSRYHTTGVLPANRKDGVYADVSQMGDYREAIEQVRLGDAVFQQLPSGVRSKFDNDPAMFLDFVSDPANAESLEELGLVEKSEPADPPSGSADLDASSTAEDGS